MSFPTHVFREYDVRGIADKEFSDDFARSLGHAFATLMQKEHKIKIVVGYDMRPSSERLRTALIDGLLSGGMHVVDLGMIPTPVLYFSVSQLKFDAGICITGSHNPIEYNGFKIHLADRSFYGSEIQGLREVIQGGAFHQAQGHLEKLQILEDYKDYVLSHFKRQKKLKVVVDSGHGMGGIVAPDLLRRLGHEVIELYSNLDPHFPDHHPDPARPENLTDLQSKVKEVGADIGVAYDGDADRIGVVDEKGEVIAGDKILLLCARYILKQKPNAIIIGDVKCSQAVYEDILEHGGRPLMWKTGHSVIKAKMKETQAELAGELSGHIFFKDRWLGFDDAMYATCRVLEILDEDKRSLSEHFNDLPKLIATPEIHFECPDDEKFNLMKRVVETLKERFKVIDIDGARVVFDDGWGLVRASNTQPVLVMRFEAQTQERLNEIRDLIQETVYQLSGKV